MMRCSRRADENIHVVKIAGPVFEVKRFSAHFLRKVRRSFIAEKYAVLIEALYEGRREQYIETQVKFEDGRKGVVSATLPIREARCYPAAQERSS